MTWHCPLEFRRAESGVRPETLGVNFEPADSVCHNGAVFQYVFRVLQRKALSRWKGRVLRWVQVASSLRFILESVQTKTRNHETS